MSSSSHRQALTAFEKDIPVVSGLQSKIANFQKKQTEQSKLKKEYYNWIRTGTELNDAEAATTKQILQACSNVLELMQKEKDHEENYEICDVDPSIRADANRSLLVVMSDLRKPARDFACKDKDILLRRVLVGINGQSNTEGEARDERALCAKLLLDLRETLASSIDEFDESYSIQSNEAIEHRRGAMLLLAQKQNNDQRLLPVSLQCSPGRTIEANLRRKEMTLRLKTMRLERDESQKSAVERLAQAAAKKVGDDYQKELQHTLRVLESKHAVLKHRVQQVGVQKENCSNTLKGDFADDIKSRRRQHTNRTRSNFRQAQIDRKNVAQKMAKEEAARVEEARIERLNALATSVPYFKAVSNKPSDIHKTTEARKNDVYAGPSELADFQCGNLKSFTQEKLLSNPNFRLGNALHEAGLAQSSYARDKVRQAIPRSEERTTGIKPY